ncbi:MAG: SLBB domain-containing protein, partial [Fervidobacterium sp.]
MTITNPDLKTLFAKLGGLIITPDSYYTSDKVYIIRDGKVVQQYNAIDIFKGAQNATLIDGDFVYVTETQPKQVYVFGKGMPNGLVRFTQSEELDLRTLIGKLGGLKEGISRKITIIDNEGAKTISWNEYTNTTLKTNTTVVFDVDTESYVYIIDQTGKPNMVYTDRTITLYEVLTKIGINKTYKKLELTSGTQKQSIELKDISQARNYNIKPGDIIKILDTPENFAYVLGEVNKPGIISLSENTTVLQAIIQSGYFTTKAVPSSVWLYKGGVNGKPIRVNLAAATSGGNIEYNPIVEPGDVVFVPADMFKTAL